MNSDNAGKKETATLYAEKARRKIRQVQKLRFVALTPDPKSKLDSSHSNTTGESSSSSSDGGRDELNKERNLVFGHVSIMGRRREMEDAVMVAPPGWLSGEYTFFGVYDGHGGAKAAEICRERLHMCLEMNIEKVKKVTEERNYFDWNKVMVECFSCVDEMLLEEEEKLMGSTAMVVVMGKEEIVVANCGDSRAVLCRDGAAVPLSTDHKPDRPDEKERIEAAGGTILNWNGSRVQGVLATTRSLGDHHLKPYVICEPEVTVVTRTETDMFMIIATDGLWDVVSNELACEIVKKCLSGQLRRHTSDWNGATEAAAVLAELAVAKASTDNISIIVVQLRF